MVGSWSDDYDELGDTTTSDLDNGDFVTLARFGDATHAYEVLLTFSDVVVERLKYDDTFVERRMFNYAGDASAHSWPEDSEESAEE